MKEGWLIRSYWRKDWESVVDFLLGRDSPTGLKVHFSRPTNSPARRVDPKYPTEILAYVFQVGIGSGPGDYKRGIAHVVMNPSELVVGNIQSEIVSNPDWSAEFVAQVKRLLSPSMDLKDLAIRISE